MPKIANQLQAEEKLLPDESIASPNGKYTFIYQKRGNLVLYRNTDGAALWASHTDNQPGDVCIMQGAGNLVIYKEPGLKGVLWHEPESPSPSRLVVQDDGNVVMYRVVADSVSDGTVSWATNTDQREIDVYNYT
jgi:hypothetical protein